MVAGAAVSSLPPVSLGSSRERPGSIVWPGACGARVRLAQARAVGIVVRTSRQSGGHLPSRLHCRRSRWPAWRRVASIRRSETRPTIEGASRWCGERENSLVDLFPAIAHRSSCPRLWPIISTALPACGVGCGHPARPDRSIIRLSGIGTSGLLRLRRLCQLINYAAVRRQTSEGGCQAKAYDNAH